MKNSDENSLDWNIADCDVNGIIFIMKDDTLMLNKIRWNLMSMDEDFLGFITRNMKSGVVACEDWKWILMGFKKSTWCLCKKKFDLKNFPWQLWATW